TGPAVREPRSREKGARFSSRLIRLRFETAGTLKKKKMLGHGLPIWPRLFFRCPQKEFLRMPVGIGANLSLRVHLVTFLSPSSANSRRYDRAASVASMLRARIRKQAARNSRRRSSVLDQFAQSPASCGCAGGQTVSSLKSASGQKSCRAQEINLGLIYLGITE